MSSDLRREYYNINNGIVTIFPPCNSQDLYERKYLGVLGVVPLGTFCYICGEDAIQNYNSFKVCEWCLNKLGDAVTDMTSYTFGTNRIVYCGYNQWTPLVPIGSGDYVLKREEGKFIPSDPEEIIKVSLLGKLYRDESNIKCFNCNNMSWDYFKHEDHIACEECVTTALSYFDLTPDLYLFLKIIFGDDIAKYTVLLYFKVKLRNCSYPK